ncbi:MAG: histone deacetylase [Methanolinea sp.]|nr:histone deacetylase [Methanolinea sp.]
MPQRCSVIFGEEFTSQDMGIHEENSRRLQDAVCGIPSGIRIRPPEAAGKPDLERVHHPRHIRMIEELCAYEGKHYLDMDTFITGETFRLALLAAGSSIAAARLALEGEHAFALVRPPGHHAEPDRAMGFCIFNNASVAAAWALEQVDRVAIVDWDLHHGNGTQKIFYRSDRVLFCSIHQANLFPWTGWIDEIGEDRGKGFNLNAPLPPGAGIGDYALIFSSVFCEAIRHFRPDLVIISAGQDPLADDPKGGMQLVPDDFGVLTTMIQEASGSALALVLEGGYGPSMGLAVSSILNVLQGKPAPPPRHAPVRESVQRISSLLTRVMI